MKGVACETIGRGRRKEVEREQGERKEGRYQSWLVHVRTHTHLPQTSVLPQESVTHTVAMDVQHYNFHDNVVCVVYVLIKMIVSTTIFISAPIATLLGH